MFEDEERWSGYRMEMREVISPEGRRWDVSIQRRDQREVWRTVHVSSWEGAMLDYADTLASEAMSAFLFGQRRDLARAAGHTHKLARAHARTHDRSGTF